MVDLIPAVDYDLVTAQALELECHTPREKEAPPVVLDVPAMTMLVTPAEQGKGKDATSDAGAGSHDDYGRQVCHLPPLLFFQPLKGSPVGPHWSI